ncbi:MAG: bifunctional nuclease family protein [Acidimicrobiales bacterium]
MVPVTILGVHVEAQSGSPIVLLGDDREEQRVLPIFVGPVEARSIALALQGVEPPRPATHDLMVDVLEAMGWTLAKVEVTELREGTFIAELELVGPGGDQRVSSRPSDGIALAARTGTPIFAAGAVLDEAGVEVQREDDGQEFDEAEVQEIMEEFHTFLETAGPEDFVVEPDEDDDENN